MTVPTITRGDDVTLDVTVTDEDDAALDLTGATLWWTAKMRQFDTDAAAVIAKTTPSGVVVTDAAGGVAEVRLVPADTEDLDNSVALWWDLQMKDGAGKVRTLAKGRLVVNADVTRATTV